MSLTPACKQDLFGLLHALRDAELSCDQSRQLRDLIMSDDEALALYCDHAFLMSRLRWAHDGDGATIVNSGQPLELCRPAGTSPMASLPTAHLLSKSQVASSWSGRMSRMIGLAVPLLLIGYFVAMAGLLAWDHVHRVHRHRQVAEQPAQSLAAAQLVHAADAAWQQTPLAGGDGKKQSLQVRSGLAELKFAQGAKVLVQGPAEFEALSPNRGFLHRGRLIAIVPPTAIGFTVATPSAEIVDLGTEFGVEVDDDQNSEVHVFTGVVVARPPKGSSLAAKDQAVRITAGGALRVDGRQSTFTPIPSNPHWRSEFAGNSAARPVIVSAEPSSGRKYRVVHGGLVDNKRAYLELNSPAYQWMGIDNKGIPRELLGADFVQVADADGRKPNLQLHVTVAVPATLYVFFDTRTDEIADWLKKDFTDTGLSIGLEAPDDPDKNGIVRFAVWKRHVPAGTIVLGPNNRGEVAHYAVAAVADLGSPQVDKK